MAMAQTVLRIGELAVECGVSIDTIRYYERRKLLPHAGRTSGGFRLYTPAAVERLRFIKQAQEIGFSLDEIGGLLSSGGAAECQRVRDLLRAKLGELDERIEAMHKFRGSLAEHLAACERELRLRGKAARCPVIVEITQVSRSPRTVPRSEKRRWKKK